MQHTPECNEALARHDTQTSAYKARWPNYCKTCNGVGASYGLYDPSPTGVSLSPGYLIDAEPCPDCSEKGVCARCGKPGLTSEERGDSSTGDGPCMFCGWTAKNGGIGEPECICPFQ